MATYVIQTNVDEDMIQDMLDDLETELSIYTDEENEEQLERIEKLEKFKGVIKVSSLEDYWELLEEVSELTDGNYQIFNQGRYIEFFSGWD